MGAAIDITGQKFGKLTALYRVNSAIYKAAVWHCRCECGNERDYTGSDLRGGRIKSCGCGRKGKHPQYKCVCEGCGKEFLSQNSFAKYCSEACGRKCRRQDLIEDRPFSDITEKLICMYHAEGKIADIQKAQEKLDQAQEKLSMLIWIAKEEKE